MPTHGDPEREGQPVTWNYRVLHRQARLGSGDRAEVQDIFALVEVYYDDSDTMIRWTDPVTVGGYDDVEHLRIDLAMLSQALTRATLIECASCRKLYAAARCPVHGRNLLAPPADDN
jgi:hypothetical protein